MTSYGPVELKLYILLQIKLKCSRKKISFKKRRLFLCYFFSLSLILLCHFNAPTRCNWENKIIPTAKQYFVGKEIPLNFFSAPRCMNSQPSSSSAFLCSNLNLSSFLCVCLYVCKYVCVYVCVSMCVFVFVCVCCYKCMCLCVRERERERESVTECRI